MVTKDRMPGSHSKTLVNFFLSVPDNNLFRDLRVLGNPDDATSGNPRAPSSKHRSASSLINPFFFGRDGWIPGRRDLAVRSRRKSVLPPRRLSWATAWTARSRESSRSPQPAPQRLELLDERLREPRGHGCAGAEGGRQVSRLTEHGGLRER